jgi:large subunit ribosomal protein L4
MSIYKQATLNKEVAETKVNGAVLHQSVVSYLNTARAGSANSKTRGEVSGSGKKPWKQKGTGNARAGSIRSPLWIKGGVIFGPKPRDFSHYLPKKMSLNALKSALSIKKDNLFVLNAKGAELKKTKELVVALKEMADKKWLFVVSNLSSPIGLSARNLKNADVVKDSALSVYHLVWADNVFFDEASYEKLTKRLDKE